MIRFMLLAWASLLATQAFAQQQLIQTLPTFPEQEQTEWSWEDKTKWRWQGMEPELEVEFFDPLPPYNTVIPFPTPQSPFFHHPWSQAIFVHLEKFPLEPLDVKSLGVSDLSQPIDIYVLYRDNQPQGFFIRPPDKSALEILRQLHAAGYKVTVLLSRFGKAIVSSVDQVATDVLQKVCKASIRPDELQIELSVGASVFVSVGGAVSLTYSLESLCSQPGMS